MKGIHPFIVFHMLNILPIARPVRQRVRRFYPNRQKIIRDEIDKLLEAGFIKEVEYPDWLENVVVVPKRKANGGCASITPTSIMYAQKTVFLCHG